MSADLVGARRLGATATSLALLLVAPLANGATRTWTGTANGLWSTPANWGGSAPVAGDDLVSAGLAFSFLVPTAIEENSVIRLYVTRAAG